MLARSNLQETHHVPFYNLGLNIYLDRCSCSRYFQSAYKIPKYFAVFNLFICTPQAHAIHWIVIYPVDNVIHLFFNDPGQLERSLRGKRFCGVREQRITSQNMEQVKEAGSFHLSSFIFGSRPIFRAGKTPKIPFLVFLCSQNPRKRLLRRLARS